LYKVTFEDFPIRLH